MKTATKPFPPLFLKVMFSKLSNLLLYTHFLLFAALAFEGRNKHISIMMVKRDQKYLKLYRPADEYQVSSPNIFEFIVSVNVNIAKLPTYFPFSLGEICE